MPCPVRQLGLPMLPADSDGAAAAFGVTAEVGKGEEAAEEEEEEALSPEPSVAAEARAAAAAMAPQGGGGNQPMVRGRAGCCTVS